MKRAIILVPGFGRREKNSARSELVSSLLVTSDGWSMVTREGTATADADVVELEATNRSDGSKVTLDVYEAFWGDLIPDWSHESPWARLHRGFDLIWYWALGGLGRSALSWSWPRRTLVALVFGALLLAIWYAGIILLFLAAITDGDGGMPAPLMPLLETVGLDKPIAWLATVAAGWSLGALVIGLATLGSVEGIANISSFTKLFLQDLAENTETAGVRTKAKARLLTQLDHVTEAKATEAYDEVYVVAHSLGGAVAVDALAEYGKPLTKTVLFTWGSALGSLVQQEPMLEAEIQKLCRSKHQLKAWVDVVFKRDFMGSITARRPPVTLSGELDHDALSDHEIIPSLVEPALPRGLPDWSERIHGGYYQSKSTIQLLVEPSKNLPVISRPVLSQRSVLEARTLDKSRLDRQTK